MRTGARNDDDMKIEVGTVITFKDETYVVEDMIHRHGWTPDKETTVWGHWLTLRKLTKDLRYNRCGTLKSIYLEELQRYETEVVIVGRMQKMFVWPEKTPVDNRQDYGKMVRVSPGELDLDSFAIVASPYKADHPIYASGFYNPDLSLKLPSHGVSG